jgi:hypothetical protein
MSERSRTTTAAGLTVLTVAAPELLGGALLLLVGLPFALGLGALAGHGSIGDSVLFGLTMVVPGVAVGAIGLWGVAAAVALLRRRRWALRASLAYAGFVAATGLTLIVFGDEGTGLTGALVLAAGTVLLSVLPMPSIREDLVGADVSARQTRGRERRAL